MREVHGQRAVRQAFQMAGDARKLGMVHPGFARSAEAVNALLAKVSEFAWPDTPRKTTPSGSARL